MPSEHSLLGGSNAVIYLACPPSARLGAQFPEETSPYAEEGTRAHALCERKLLKAIGAKKLPAIDFEPDDEMEECSDNYVAFVMAEYEEALKTTRDTEIRVEQKVDFSEYVPEGFGTADCLIVSDDLLEIVDFKYGKGVPVEAEGNPQLRLYALGAINEVGDLYAFQEVKMTIFQPRIDHTNSATMGVDDLIQWGNSYVKPRAELAFKGEGEFCVGEHCRFCKAGAVCKARVKEAFEIVEHEPVSPTIIPDEEIPALLDKLDNAKKWIAALEDYAQERAIRDGVRWDGYKLVESRTQRKITDPVKALDILEDAGYDVNDVTTLKLKGITELEKIVSKKKFNELLGELVEKPVGAPVLVKESDKRPEITLVELAFKEENEND